jgi:hypothetical protein
MSNKVFTFGTGAAGTAGTTGISNTQSAKGVYKVVTGEMGPEGGTATVIVLGSINGDAGPFVTLSTLSLSGVSNIVGMSGVEQRAAAAYDTLKVNVSAISGTGANVAAKLRFVK